MRKLTCIDLFAGCGGLSLGLHKAGLRGVFAIEKNPDAFQTLKENLIDRKKHFNWPTELDVKSYDINYILKAHSKFLKDLKGKIDVIAGGPPCQGFSLAGKRQSNDKRNSLVFSYLKFVEIISPKIILFENVQGFAWDFQSSTKGNKTVNYSQFVIKRLSEMGYRVDFKLVDFSEYGVPQKRKRFILVGVKGKRNKFFEKLEEAAGETLSSYNLKRLNTSKDALSDLEMDNGFINSESERFRFGLYSRPATAYQRMMRHGANSIPDSHRFANHSQSTEDRFKKIINLCQGKQVSGRALRETGTKKQYVNVLVPEVPGPTLTTLPDDVLHYKEPRILTVREYARLQSFPDWYEFKGKYTTGGKMRKVEVPRYSQIGNAIPPLFAEICGLAILKTLA